MGRAKTFLVGALISMALMVGSCGEANMTTPGSPIGESSIEVEIIELNWNYAVKDLYYPCFDSTEGDPELAKADVKTTR